MDATLPQPASNSCLLISSHADTMTAQCTAHSLVRALHWCTLVWTTATVFWPVLLSLWSILSSRYCVLLLVLWSDCRSDRVWVMQCLHSLPFLERVTFKLCTVTYKCLHDSAPSYLINIVYSSGYCYGTCSLVNCLLVWTSADSIHKHGVCTSVAWFQYACSAAWNTLSATLTENSLSLFAFKRQFKTFLFNSGWLQHCGPFVLFLL